MSKPDPEISKKLIDALALTFIEQGAIPGTVAVAERAGVNKMLARAQFPTHADLTVAALERVGAETRRNLESAANQPDNGRSPFDCATNRIVERLSRQLTDRDNPAGLITACLLCQPGPGSKIRAAAAKEHAAIAGWLVNHFRARDTMPLPQKAANALMALLHGTYANVLGSGLDAWRSIVEIGTLMTYILIACSREKTAVPYEPKTNRRRARKGRERVPQGSP